MFGVFRVKNHDFTPKNHIFSNIRGAPVTAPPPPPLDPPLMMFNHSFINISVISWQSVLLVEEIGVPGENHRPDASH